MPRPDKTTNAEFKFLRALRTHPAGPPPECWPSPAVFRRWLRKPGFRDAMREIQHTLHFQTDLHLAAAASRAAQTIGQYLATIQPPSPNPAAGPQSEIPSPNSQLTNLLHLLRLSHIRQRFNDKSPLQEFEPKEEEIRELAGIGRMMRDDSKEVPKCY